MIEANSAEDALSLTGIEGLGLILSDVILEGAQTGPEFLDALAQTGLDVPMLLMTSLPLDDPRRKNAGVPRFAQAIHHR